SERFGTAENGPQVERVLNAVGQQEKRGRGSRRQDLFGIVVGERRHLGDVSLVLGRAAKALQGRRGLDLDRNFVPLRQSHAGIQLVCRQRLGEVQFQRHPATGAERFQDGSAPPNPAAL